MKIKPTFTVACGILLLLAGVARSERAAEELYHFTTRLDADSWRTQPVPGRAMEMGAGIIMPGDPQRMEFLDETDFPYLFEKYGDDPEKPFFYHTDEVMLVRFLGGRSRPQNDPASADIAYRDENGNIQLRREKLRERIRLYEEAGVIDRYNIVLDNVPYSFMDTPAMGNFGNGAPPDDLGEWSDFIVEVCEELRDVLGEERANQIRFRLGTELQGKPLGRHNSRFEGSQELYFEFYRVTAEAVKSVLPGASVGPFNISAIDQGLDSHNLDYREIAAYLFKNDLPFDFIAHSMYIVPLFGESSPLHDVTPTDWNRLTNADPREKIRYYEGFWEELEVISPRIKDIPLEIHEFGILGNETGLRSNNMDGGLSPRHAANLFQLIFLSKRAGVERIFHWGLSRTIPGSTKRLPNAHAWLLHILSHAEGSDMWQLPVRNGNNRSISRPLAMAFLDADNGKSYVILSLFNPYRYLHAEEDIRVVVPKNLVDLDQFDVSETRLDYDTWPQRAMREDLAKAGLLTEDYLLHPGIMPFYQRGIVPESVGDIKAASKLLRENEQKYIDLCKESLTLHPFDGTIEDSAVNAMVTFKLRAPSVVVLELTPKSDP